jgi:gas vesicle protein
MSNESRGGEFLAGVILGALVGGAAALLLAPQSGEETQAQLREKGIELKERVSELSEEARKKAEQWQDEGLSALQTQKAHLEEAIGEGKKAAAKKKKELLKELEQEGEEAQA